VFQIKIHLERIWNTLVRLKQVKIRDCSTVPDVPDGLAQKKILDSQKGTFFTDLIWNTWNSMKSSCLRLKLAFQMRSRSKSIWNIYHSRILSYVKYTIKLY